MRITFVLFAVFVFVSARPNPPPPPPDAPNGNPPPPPPPGAPSGNPPPPPPPGGPHGNPPPPPPPNAQNQHSDQSGTTPVAILEQSSEVEANGTFKYSFKTSNGISVEQDGELKPNPEGKSADNSTNDEEGNQEILVIKGSFSYTAPDGQNIVLKYVADENGFQPEGDHLPTTPPGFNAPPADNSNGETNAQGAQNANESPEQRQSKSLPPAEDQAVGEPATAGKDDSAATQPTTPTSLGVTSPTA